jgi:deoxyribodipyrimidine photolyase
MHVWVAGAQPAHVQALLNVLPMQLPPGVHCEVWPVSDAAQPHDVVLLLALVASDLDASNADTSPAERDADESLRAQLMQQGVAFQVIHGPASTHAQQAQHAIAQALRQHDPELAQQWMREEIAPRWQGVCESCSDPECEHRLFSRFLRT